MSRCLVCALLLLAAGCGQTGALRLPDQPAPKKSANPFQKSPAASTAAPAASAAPGPTPQPAPAPAVAPDSVVPMAPAPP